METGRATLGEGGRKGVAGHAGVGPRHDTYYIGQAESRKAYSSRP